MNTKAKSLEFVPKEKKILYSKILALMLSENIQPQKIVAFYRLLGQIMLGIEERLILHSFIANLNESIAELCLELFDNVVEQEEKNILRFSLIKDLVVIMRSGSGASLKEKQLFNKVKILLEVPEEYISYFESEYDNDQIELDENIGEGLIANIIKNQLAQATALGIPIIFLYYRGYLRNILLNSRRRKVLLILQSIGLIKRKRIEPYDVITALSLGALTYGVAKYLLNKQGKSDRELKKLVFRHAQDLHDRAIDYLVKDINYMKENNKELFINSWNLLDEALNLLKSSKPILL